MSKGPYFVRFPSGGWGESEGHAVPARELREAPERRKVPVWREVQVGEDPKPREKPAKDEVACL